MSIPQAKDVAEKIKRLDRIHSAGCCLHVQIDDGNLSNKFFDAESKNSIKEGHNLCLDIFLDLELMRPTARRKACKLAEYDHE